MEIKSTEYRIAYDAATGLIQYEGVLQLGGMEAYGEIIELLDQIATQPPPVLTLSIENLSFLNSSGINVLSKFVLKLRKNAATKLLVRGSSKIPWQGKSLHNLHRLMPELQLEWVD